MLQNYFFSDDKDLPCVPPISIKVPEAYPEKPPQCLADESEYAASEFLLRIHHIFYANLNKLPEFYSVTSLLSSWVSNKYARAEFSFQVN